jgi:transposase-like protein
MIEDGHSIGAAARSNGVTVQTFFNWMERGQQQDTGDYADFFDRITRARGAGEKRYVDVIAEIAKETNDTATLMSLLKSRYPNSWGDVDRSEQSGGVEVVVPDEATIE